MYVRITSSGKKENKSLHVFIFACLCVKEKGEEECRQVQDSKENVH